VLHGLGRDDQVAGFELGIQPAGDPGDDDLVRMEVLDDQRGDHRGVDLAGAHASHDGAPPGEPPFPERNAEDSLFFSVLEFVAQDLDFARLRTENRGHRLGGFSGYRQRQDHQCEDEKHVSQTRGLPTHLTSFRKERFVRLKSEPAQGRISLCDLGGSKTRHPRRWIAR